MSEAFLPEVSIRREEVIREGTELVLVAPQSKAILYAKKSTTLERPVSIKSYRVIGWIEYYALDNQYHQEKTRWIRPIDPDIMQLGLLLQANGGGDYAIPFEQVPVHWYVSE